MLALGALLGCAGTAPLPPKAVALNAAGVDALGRGDLLTAEARFAVALEYHPRFVDALVNLALVEMQRGNFKLARRKLDRAVLINRHIAQPHHGLGLLEEREEHPARAVKHYREALAVDPGFAPARANLARIHFESGQFDDAREQFLRLVEVAPGDALGYAGLADSLEQLGREDEADAVVAKATARLGEPDALRVPLARMALRRGDTSAARAALLPLRERGGPLAREAWAWLGVTSLLEGDTLHALRCAEQSLAVDRDHPLATYVLAMALVQREDRDAAVWLDRARALAPGNSVITQALSKARRAPEKSR